MARFAEGDISLVAGGGGIVVAHQTNCRGAIGGGVSGPICRRWPEVRRRYRELCSRKSPAELFGTVQPVRTSDGTIVCNVFSQLDYGNSARSGVRYTDEDRLVAAMRRICDRYPEAAIAVPERIGCGLAGGDWDSVLARLGELPVNIVRYVPGVRPELRSQGEIADAEAVE